jgi:hypothetical protein
MKKIFFLVSLVLLSTNLFAQKYGRVYHCKEISPVKTDYKVVLFDIDHQKDSVSIDVVVNEGGHLPGMPNRVKYGREDVNGKRNLNVKYNKQYDYDITLSNSRVTIVCVYSYPGYEGVTTTWVFKVLQLKDIDEYHPIIESSIFGNDQKKIKTTN